MKYLVTGGCGFLGSNISKKILENNDELIIFDNLSRLGSEKNLEWLKQFGQFNFINGDIRNNQEIEDVIKTSKPNIIFHLAGQVAMTTSIQDPRMDFEINTLGTFNLLNAIRNFSPDTGVIYSSTNKVYGDLEWVNYIEESSRYITPDYPQGFDENINLDFHSPYGCSKGAADQYMLDFSRIYDLKTVVFRHSSMFGGRQFSSYDQGWIGWFCLMAIKSKNKTLSVEGYTISGNGKQVRDVLYSDDMVSLYLKAASNIEKIKGNAYNIGGGVDNSLSLLELFDILEAKLDVKLNYKKLPDRKSDQKVFIADITKIQNSLDWKPQINKLEGIYKALEWIQYSN